MLPDYLWNSHPDLPFCIFSFLNSFLVQNISPAVLEPTTQNVSHYQEGKWYPLRILSLPSTPFPFLSFHRSLATCINTTSPSMSSPPFIRSSKTKHLLSLGLPAYISLMSSLSVEIRFFFLHYRLCDHTWRRWHSSSSQYHLQKIRSSHCLLRSGHLRLPYSFRYSSLWDRLEYRILSYPS